MSETLLNSIILMLFSFVIWHLKRLYQQMESLRGEYSDNKVQLVQSTTKLKALEQENQGLRENLNNCHKKEIADAFASGEAYAALSVAEQCNNLACNNLAKKCLETPGPNMNMQGGPKARETE